MFLGQVSSGCQRDGATTVRFLGLVYLRGSLAERLPPEVSPRAFADTAVARVVLSNASNRLAAGSWQKAPGTQHGLMHAALERLHDLTRSSLNGRDPVDEALRGNPNRHIIGKGMHDALAQSTHGSFMFLNQSTLHGREHTNKAPPARTNLLTAHGGRHTILSHGVVQAGLSSFQIMAPSTAHGTVISKDAASARQPPKNASVMLEKAACAHSKHVEKHSAMRQGSVMHAFASLTGINPEVLFGEGALPLWMSTIKTQRARSWRYLNMLFDLGGGTGASLTHSTSSMFGQDLIRRMRLQDTAAMLLMAAVYFSTLVLTASVAYRQAANSSPVTFYADPRYHAAVTEGHELGTFLDAFGQPPKNMYLHAAGFTPVVGDAPNVFHWHGRHYSVDFTFSLDISPWVVREISNHAFERPGNGESIPLQDGVVTEDMEILRQFLENDTNDLGTVEMSKEILWPHWEELATNMKHQIRQCEYEGMIGIDRTKHESVFIYKNKQWANFMHSRTIKVVLALSIVGWALYLPYFWLRSTKIRVRCLYRVNIAINDYWQLIAAHLTANGFNPPTANVMTGNGWAPPGLSSTPVDDSLTSLQGTDDGDSDTIQ